MAIRKGSNNADTPSETIIAQIMGDTPALLAILPNGKLNPIRVPVISSRKTGL